MNYVDLHSHVLWGIDDGAQTLADSVEMLRLLQTVGFGTVCATPHQKLGAFVPTQDEIAHRYGDVSASVEMPLYVAAENYWDELFLTRAQTGAQPGYRQRPETPGGDDAGTDGPPKAFLFELPIVQLPPRLEEQLFAFRLRGVLPVMAHPERYVPLWAKRDRFEALGRCAALVVDLPALDGAHGPDRARMARYLVQEGLCHAAASDIHHVSDARAVAAGINWIKKKMGMARLTALLSDGPRQILAGELPELPA